MAQTKLQILAQTNPEEARKLLKELKSKVMDPHPAQRQVIESPARFKVLNAGRRFGKTQTGANMAVRKAREPNQMIWWVGPTYKVVKRGYNAVLKQIPKQLLAKEAPMETAFDNGRTVVLQFKNGTRMEFYSAERPQGMLGEGVDFAVLDEAATMDSTVWTQIVRPTLMDRRGGALFISTPRGRNWFYGVYRRGQDPQDTNWASWTFTSDDNPYLPEGEMDDIVADLPANLFDQEVKAKFLAAGSSVFQWPAAAMQTALPKETSNLIPGENFDGHHVVLGIDLAKKNDWTVLYGASAETRRNVFFERMNGVRWSEQRRRIARAVSILQRAGAASVTLVMDSTGVGDPIVEEMEEQGFDVVDINFTTHKDNMVKRLAKDLEDGKAFILELYSEEFLSYQMFMTRKGKITYSAPSGEHDDVVSAKMLQHWGIVEAGVPGFQAINLSEDETMLSAEAMDELQDMADDFSDLLDEEDLREIEQARQDKANQAQVDLHLAVTRPPTIAELLNRDEVWSSFHGDE